MVSHTLGLVAKQPVLLRLFFFGRLAAGARLSVVNGLLVTRLSLVLEFALLEDVAGSATTGMLSASAWSPRDAAHVVSKRADRALRMDSSTHAFTSWRKRVSAGSLFLAMLPVPPRPVVTKGFLRIGVSRSVGVSWGDLVASFMLPAPPRPWEARPDIAVQVLLGSGSSKRERVCGSECCGRSQRKENQVGPESGEAVATILNNKHATLCYREKMKRPSLGGV